jgi:hypothetical protein
VEYSEEGRINLCYMQDAKVAGQRKSVPENSRENL